MQEQTKENKLPVVLLAVIIVVLLVESIGIGIFGGGGKKVETAVPKKDIKAAREAAELSDEGEVQTIAIDKDIIVNAGGTGSADEKSEMQIHRQQRIPRQYRIRKITFSRIAPQYF